ncbi:hypothetical protein HYV11_03365 [Candidatus Dependentiae bacterium]|nr:hypothetical protein [Candidatus Dependentiae bacterium]
MKRGILKIILCYLLSEYTIPSILFSKESSTEQIKQKKRSAVALSSQLIDFKYEQEDLKNILSDFAEQRNINLIFNETDTINSKVTINIGKKITMTEAWEFLMMILNQAGFSLIYRDDYSYLVVANKSSYKESIPLYVNIDYHTLPDTAEKIRYLYFCNTIQLTRQQAELTAILKNIFSDTDINEKLILDTNNNMIIFTTASEVIKSAMQLISVLDEVGFQETIEMLELKYARASEVTQILTNMLGTADQKKAGSFISLSTMAPKARYFSEYANIIDVDPKGTRKLNSLILLGKSQDVERIKDFINKYLDIPQQQGKTFYHVLELEWIQAKQLVDILNSLVQATQSGGSGQSTGTLLSDLAFDPQIKIIAEKISQGLPANNNALSNISGASTVTNTIQSGGNRIVVAATERDWHRIEALIKQVDLPKKQVIVEIIVVDLDLQFIRRLATQLRTKGLCSSIFPKDMQAQAGLVTSNIIRSTGTDSNNNTIVPNDWVGNLSNILAGSAIDAGDGFLPPDYGTENSGQIQWTESFSSASPIFNSSTLFMIQDPSSANATWAFFQLLTTHKTAKILTRPVIIASNNVPANVTSATLKNLAGGVTTSATPSINYGSTTAPISIEFRPLISNNNTVSLGLNICLNLWQNALNPTSGAQMNRQVSTTVSMKSGDVMIIGGLIREVVSRNKMSVPFFDKIPILGSFLANRFKNTTRDQLFILLRPTVVAPRLEGGMNKITQSAANFVIKEFENYEDAFSNLKDPITRWFFNEDEIEGSIKVDSKISELTSTDLSNATDVDIEKNIIANFYNPTIDNTPLHVGWFSDGTNSSQQNFKNKQLKEKLTAIVNPFEKK